MANRTINIRQHRKGNMKGKLTKTQRIKRIKAHKKATQKWYRKSGKEYYRNYYIMNKDRIRQIQEKYKKSRKGQAAIARYEATKSRKKQKVINQRRYRARLKKKGGKK